MDLHNKLINACMYRSKVSIKSIVKVTLSALIGFIFLLIAFFVYFLRLDIFCVIIVMSRVQQSSFCTAPNCDTERVCWKSINFFNVLIGTISSQMWSQGGSVLPVSQYEGWGNYHESSNTVYIKLSLYVICVWISSPQLQPRNLLS